jgi:hypothetical protein
MLPKCRCADDNAHRAGARSWIMRFPRRAKKSRSIWCKEQLFAKTLWRLVDENQGSVVIISLKIKEKGDLHD